MQSAKNKSFTTIENRSLDHGMYPNVANWQRDLRLQMLPLNFGNICINVSRAFNSLRKL